MRNKGGKGEIYIGDMELGIEGEYTYLGQTVAFYKKMEKELQVRKQKAWKAYWSLRRVFKSKMSIPSEVRILELRVIPVLTYDAQLWNLTNLQYKKLQVTQRQMERSLVSITRKDRIRNREVRERNSDQGHTKKYRESKNKIWR